jgi:hypothetical protein
MRSEITARGADLRTAATLTADFVNAVVLPVTSVMPALPGRPVADGATVEVGPCVGDGLRVVEDAP